MSYRKLSYWEKFIIWKRKMLVKHPEIDEGDLLDLWVWKQLTKKKG